MTKLSTKKKKKKREVNNWSNWSTNQQSSVTKKKVCQKKRWTNNLSRFVRRGGRMWQESRVRNEHGDARCLQPPGPRLRAVRRFSQCASPSTFFFFLSFFFLSLFSSSDGSARQFPSCCRALPSLSSASFSRPRSFLPRTLLPRYPVFQNREPLCHGTLRTRLFYVSSCRALVSGAAPRATAVRPSQRHCASA